MSPAPIAWRKAAILLCWLAMESSVAAAEAAKRPLNVLFLMTDQHHAQVLGCAGNAVVKTPHLDRLAAGGMRFVNSFCAVPYCSPTRLALVTGRYPSSLGLGRNIGREIDQEDPLRLRDPCQTYLHQLAARGYHCHQLGKWHVGDPAELSCFPDARQDEETSRRMFHQRNQAAGAARFDEAQRPGEAERIGNVWLRDVTADAHRRLLQEKNRPKQDVGIIGRAVLKPEFWYESVLADYCIELLKRHRDEPFAITYSVSPPHAANIVPAPFYDLYDPATVPFPATWNQRPDALQGSFAARMAAVYGEPGVREYIRCYYAQVSMMDWCLGRILTALDELGLAQRTLVIFTSDHGNQLGQHGMIEKGVPAFYDDLMRVPLLLRLPGKIRAGQSSAAWATSVDLAPTILDYLGASPLAIAHGHSLRPYIEGRPDDDGAVFGESGDLEKPGVMRMIRTRQWKLSVSLRGPVSLFALDKDPDELRNLVAEPALAPVIRELSQKLRQHMQSIGDPALPRFAEAGAPPAPSTR